MSASFLLIHCPQPLPVNLLISFSSAPPWTGAWEHRTPLTLGAELGSSSCYDARSYSLQGFCGFAALGWGQDSLRVDLSVGHQWGCSNHSSSLSCCGVFNQPDAGLWPPRKCCLGSWLRWLRPSLWKVQGVAFSDLITWRKEVFVFWIPWLAWRGNLPRHAGMGWRKEQTSLDKLVTWGLIRLWVGITFCSLGPCLPPAFICLDPRSPWSRRAALGCFLLRALYAYVTHRDG